ncbi:proton-conducting transporter membrane subunit [Thiococcus pfennigii]|uniref:proton-conducting transporter transmembrane domain-containing protein n=1 Tax=Thiococcus pfennigii TaxID=1057 RepID=UPI001905A6D9|nr:proton-conducting transporter membrane subunit [Thiococcus pfennigii]MBK1700054.1 hypothetical protein [Thiococcus pfennigii]
MSQALLLAIWLWPLALATVAHRPGLHWAPAAGALPALIGLLLLPGEVPTLEIPAMLLGAAVGLDALGRGFLAFSGPLWLITGLFIGDRARRGDQGGRLRTLFLLAMSGNLMLILAADGPSFYVGFALMGLAAYGLVVDGGGEARRRAARLYLAWTLVGEVLIFSGLVLVAQRSGGDLGLAALAAGTAGSGLAFAAFLAGFGIKAGLFGLHVWLPVTYGQAPSAAAAILASAMIKAGLLGWLRFLPLGGEPLPVWGDTLAALGLAAVAGASLVGLTQRLPGAILGYSSLAKMGILVLGLGLILREPALAPAGTLALTLFAAHHALVKGGLFLGIGLGHHLPPASARRPWIWLGLALLALAIADAPFSSGALAKQALAPLVVASGWPWLKPALALATLGTALLMARLAWVVWQAQEDPSRADAPTRPCTACAWAWVALIVTVIAFPFVLGGRTAPAGTPWPLVLGAALAAAVALVARRRPEWTGRLVGLIPPGDLLHLARVLEPLGGRLASGWSRLWERADRYGRERLAALAARRTGWPADPDRLADAWPLIGALWLGCLGLLGVLLALA